MSKHISLRKEWLIRSLTGLAMIPITFVLVGAVAKLMPNDAQSIAILLGAIFYIGGSMIISSLFIYRKVT